MEISHEASNAVVPEWIRQDRKKKPAAKGQVQLNKLIGQVIRETCPAGMVIRLDHLPTVNGSSLQLHYAFRELVQAIAAFPPAGSRHYLYFKFVEAKGGKSAVAGTIAVFTNISTEARCTPVICESFNRVRVLFLVNGIEISAPEIPVDDCIYLLTIAGKPGT